MDPRNKGTEYCMYIGMGWGGGGWGVLYLSLLTPRGWSRWAKSRLSDVRQTDVGWRQVIGRKAAGWQFFSRPRLAVVWQTYMPPNLLPISPTCTGQPAAAAATPGATVHVPPPSSLTHCLPGLPPGRCQFLPIQYTYDTLAYVATCIVLT